MGSAGRTLSSISRSSKLRVRRRAVRALIAIATMCFVLRPVAPAHAAWSAYPWLAFSGGYENNRLHDPDLDRFVLPGGGLLGVTPGIRLGGRLGERVRLDLSGQLGYERFQNTSDRSVLGGAVDAELRVQVGRSWLWRSALAGSRYSDSAYETANRMGGGLETGFGIVRPGWSLELIGGVEGRRYDNLVTSDDAGVLGTYTETGVSAGLSGSARVGAGGLFSARVVRQWTDARDSLYDADSWLAQASARAGIGFGTFLTLSALGQLRGFSSRPAPEDGDSYWQVGAGLDRAVTQTLRITARYAFARVTDPMGASENLHRATLAATWGLGAPSRIGGRPDLRLPGDLMAPTLRENEARLFRCHAPGAREVSLVGDFNGWDPAAHPLEPDRDGWWQVEIQLLAGSHQYAYLVDGKTMAPADAEALVDDGFGGKNGLIWVQSENP